jgi:hypothetical protein
VTDLSKFFTKTVLSLLIVLVLTSCGGGDDKGVLPTDPKPKPDPKPTPKLGTVISGVVMIKPVVNADVSVYEITLDKTNSPIKINTTPLATSSQKTNNKGEFNVSIKPTADQTPILVCATGGTYTEPASTALLTSIEKTFQSKAQLCPIDLLCEEEKLCAIAIVKRDEQLTVNLSYFSHLAYGLASSRLVKGATLLDVTRNNSNGTTSLVLGGISNANKIVSDWLQLTTTLPVNKGVISVTPQDITVTSALTNGNITLTNEIKYGLANAAISDLVEWMRLTSATTQTGPAFDKVSTVALAQQAFKDIADGDYDGLENAAPLFLSDTAINGHMLRYHFAFKLFVVASNRLINQTGLTNSDIDSFVKALNKNGVMFPSTPQVNIVNDNPVLSHIYPNDNGIIMGDVSIKIDVIDINDIASIAMTIDTVPPGGNLSLPTDVLAVNPEKPEWSITTVSEVTPTTQGIPDGIYDIKFVATNTQGATTTRTMPNIRISNKDIHLHIINPPVVSNTVGPKNPLNSLAGFEAIVNDVFFLENSMNSDVVFTMESITPGSTMAPIVIPFKITTSAPNGYSEISPISRRYFASDLSNMNPAISDGKYKLVINATSGKNVTPVLASNPDSVEFEYDTQIPSVKFAIPAFKVFTGQATVNLDVQDLPKDGYSSGIKTTTLSHDAIGGGEVPASVVNNQSVINFTEQGWHKLTLNATDYAGNAAKTKFLDVGFDILEPVVMVPRSSIENKWWNNVDIVVNVSDNETGIKEIVTGFDHKDPQTLDKAAIGTTIDLSNKPQPPNLYSSHKYVKTIDVKSMAKLGLADGVHSFMARVSDYAAPAPTHTQHDILTSIGFDITSPTITFANTSSTFTPISTNSKVTIDKQLKTININKWPVDAVIQESGYQAPTITTNGILIRGTSSGIASVTADAIPVQVSSADFLRLPVTATKSVAFTNLPQYVVTSTATKQVIWTVIATCPPLTTGVSMKVINGVCAELDANAAIVNSPATVFEWVKGAPSFVNTSDTSTTDAASVKKMPVDISATDQSLSSDNGLSGGTLNGNPVTKTACLIFQVTNITSDKNILVPKRSDSVIGTDSLAVENITSPTAGVNSIEPVASPYTCEERTAVSVIPWNGTPLVPVVITANAMALNTAICTLRGTSNSTISTVFPVAASQDYLVETKLVSPGGACP